VGKLALMDAKGLSQISAFIRLWDQYVAAVELESPERNAFPGIRSFACSIDDSPASWHSPGIDTLPWSRKAAGSQPGPSAGLKEPEKELASHVAQGMTRYMSGASSSSQARYAAGTLEILACFHEKRPIRPSVQADSLAGIGTYSCKLG
jgi:hypothetical protein